MVLYGFPHKLLVKLASFFLKAKSLLIWVNYFFGYQEIDIPKKNSG